MRLLFPLSAIRSISVRSFYLFPRGVSSKSSLPLCLGCCLSLWTYKYSSDAGLAEESDDLSPLLRLLWSVPHALDSPGRNEPFGNEGDSIVPQLFIPFSLRA